VKSEERVSRARPLLVASASPRRRELLEAVGIPLVARGFSVDESKRPGESVDGYLERVASSKLLTALRSAGPHPAVLAADTVVVLDGEILGKPESPEDARRMLAALSGRNHEVRTRFAIGTAREPERVAFASTTRTEVWFRALGEDEITRYVATGEGADKAGSYAIQGIGGFAVRRIDGSYSNVVGLPVCEVIEALLALDLLAEFPLGGA
jgi:septum formation protein